MEIKLAVFDLAGTTVKDNQDVQRVLQNALRKFDVSVTIEQASLVMGIPKPVAIRELLEGELYANISDGLIKEIHREFLQEMVRFYQTDKNVSENEGVTETFLALRDNGVKVVVDTGFDRVITDALLDRLGWLRNGYVLHSITSDDVTNGRPHPDMIFKAMELTGVTSAKQVMKVGDTVSDLQEGNAAGCGWVVGITTGAYTHEQLMTTQHTHLITRIPQVLEILNAKPGVN